MSEYLKHVYGDDEEYDEEEYYSEDEEEYTTEETQQYLYQHSSSTTTASLESIIQMQQSKQLPSSQKPVHHSTTVQKDFKANKEYIYVPPDLDEEDEKDDHETKLIPSSFRSNRSKFHRSNQNSYELKLSMELLQRICFDSSIVHCNQMHLEHISTTSLSTLCIEQFSTCISPTGQVLLHGGKFSDTQKHSTQLHQFDLQTKKWNSVMTSQSSCDYFAFAIGNAMALYDGFKQVHVYENENWNSYTVEQSILVKEMKRTRQFAAVCVESEVWVAGGCLTDDSASCTNQYFKLTYKLTNDKPAWGSRHGYFHNYLQFQMVPLFPHAVSISKKMKSIFEPRKCFGICEMNKQLIIFGGINSQGIVLNDMICITPKGVISELIPTNSSSQSIPPMHSFSMFALHSFIYVFGGVVNQQWTNTLYRFDFTNKLWSMIYMQGIPLPIPQPISQPFVLHHLKSNLYHSNKLFCVGTDSKQIKAFVIHQVDDQGEAVKLINYMKQVLLKGIHSDAVIKCKNSETNQTEVIPIHKCIVSVRSKEFLRLFQQIQGNEIWITEFEPVVIRAYLQFLYTASFQIEKSENIVNLVKMAHQFGHATELERICGYVTYMDQQAICFEKLKEDFCKLWDQETSMSYFPSVTIKVKIHSEGQEEVQEEEEEQYQLIESHKVFLLRAPYLKACFDSGMQEAVSGVIQFDDIQYKGIMQVLKYMFTDDIFVNVDTCIEVYAAAMQFELRELEVYCRNLILKSISEESIPQIIQILHFVDLYNDETLKTVCARLLVKVYEKVIQIEEYQQLSEELKRKVEIWVIEKRKTMLNKAEKEARKKNKI